ncbi:MAG TPA: methyltransferase domain-containing protein [Vicinamibacterales bacterium]|nr:methyltransferase domain-containing protein [Vicinamibacterales bacterium]
MSEEAVRGNGAAPPSAAEVKHCCARFYESEIVRRLLGESFHPGGTALTERLGVLLALSPGSLVLDAASGNGTSALFLAQRFGCRVVGVDLGVENVARATAEAERRGFANRVRFNVGDTEQLPFNDSELDAVICECAFCTFPDKPRAAREFARVLKPGGRVGLSDVTRAPGGPDELADLMAWIACLADARPANTYAALLKEAGFVDVSIENHDAVLLEMVRDVGSRLFAADVLRGLRKIDLGGFDFDAAKKMTQQARVAVAEQRLGYAVVCATKPEIGALKAQPELRP